MVVVVDVVCFMFIRAYIILLITQMELYLFALKTVINILLSINEKTPLMMFSNDCIIICQRVCSSIFLLFKVLSKLLF